MTDADADLAGRARAGDRLAFGLLARRTTKLVFAHLYLDTGDPHRAEDLVQETYLRAFRAVGTLADPAGVRPWLLSIAHRVLLDDVRAGGRRKRSAPKGETSADGVAGSGPDPCEAAGAAEERRAVLAALRELPAAYREPLALRYLAGADAATIRDQLGLSDGQLRGLLHRGLKMLRDRLPPGLADG